MKIVGAAVSLWLMQLSLSPALSASPDQRQEALQWASEHRAYVFNTLLPAASSEAVSMPTCRLTTIRSSGSLDSFEFIIRITEDCAAVDPPTGVLVEGSVRAMLVIPEGSPIDDQLATLRLNDPTLTIDSAVARVKLKTIPLPPPLARGLLRQLRETSLPVLPPIEITMDARTYELTSSAGVQTRVAMLTAGRHHGPGRQLMMLIRKTLTSLGYGPDKLAYDPAFWSSAPPSGTKP